MRRFARAPASPGGNGLTAEPHGMRPTGHSACFYSMCSLTHAHHYFILNK